MVNVLGEYNKHLNRYVKWTGLYYTTLWNFWTSIHPATETQFKHQRFLAGVNPWYGSWMESRSLDERNRNTRNQYGIRFGDITYPWLSSVTSANEAKTLGSGAWSFSKNMSRLYR